MYEESRESNHPKSCTWSLVGKICNSTLFILVLSSLVVLEYHYRDYFYTLSLSIISYFQVNYPNLTSISQGFTFFGTANGIVVCVLPTYNFVNIYKTFMLLVVGLSSCYIGGLLKVVYLNPRPFWSSPDIAALGCEGGWGNPSNHAIISVAFYLSMYHMLIQQQSTKYVKTWLSKCLIVLSLFGFIFLVCLSRIFLGVHSINQVIYGFCIGFLIYYFYFHLLDVDTNDPQQLLSIINKKTPLCFGILFMTLLPLIPYYVITIDPLLKEEFNRIINEKCPLYPQGKKFENEAFLCTWILLVLIPCLMGMHMEFDQVFNFNIVKWSRYNFGTRNEMEVGLLMTSNDYNNDEDDDTQWNSTNLFTSFGRLVTIVVILGTIMALPYISVSWDDHFALILLVKILIPTMIISMMMFNQIKHLCRSMNLTNENLFNPKDPYVYTENLKYSNQRVADQL